MVPENVGDMRYKVEGLSYKKVKYPKSLTKNGEKGVKTNHLFYNMLLKPSLLGIGGGEVRISETKDYVDSWVNDHIGYKNDEFD